ncbi:MAG: PTS system mannose/fructose/sorbose family transporter subunit IID, partial [Deltaproteobacteria bacterium]|nr:PTS system mannose/fructose/sorbose family transporter subunit IID [Deltaproteobacteria bacterium]
MIKNITLLKVFFHSFFIQSSWNFERLQSLGFAAAVSPALREIYTEKTTRMEAVRRHLEYYNSHPYMAGPVLGTVINMEERAVRGELSAQAASGFKKAVMGPYGAIGDMFFWAAIRPLSSVIGISGVIFFGAWGILGFLLFY